MQTLARACQRWLGKKTAENARMLEEESDLGGQRRETRGEARELFKNHFWA